MENQDNSNIQTHEFDVNSNFDPEKTVHVLTPTDSSDQIFQDFTPSTNVESTAGMRPYKILNGSPVLKSTDKKKIALQSAASSPQKIHMEFNSPTKKAILFQSPFKSNISPSRRGPSQLRIYGKKIVDDSISLIRPMKCCNYDIPDIISPTPASSQKTSMRSSVPATWTMMRRQQLQEQRIQKIRMAQQNIIVNSKNPDRLVTQEDMKKIRKSIDLLERKQKMNEEAKKKEKNPENQNPNFINLLPTGLL